MLVFHTPSPCALDGIYLIKALDEIADRKHRSQKIVMQLLKALLNVAYDELVNAKTFPQGHPKLLWQKVVDFMDEHSHEPLDRNTVASHFRLHPNSLSRLFKQFDKETFQKHLTRLRLERSSMILRDLSLSLEEVAARSGFSNANYFIRVFKDYYNQTPGQFRGGF